MPAYSGPHAALLARAYMAYYGFARDSEQRRQIEYIGKRLSAPPRDEDDALNHALLAKRLTDIIRPRAAGSLI